MLAIYKKELRAYFNGMTGWLFLFFFFLVVAIYSYVYNVMSRFPEFEYVLYSISLMFTLLTPMVTMRVLAEEAKQKTDQLLLTSGVSAEKIVTAKFLATGTLLVIAMAISSVYPLVLSLFGNVNFKTAYSAIIGFMFMGFAYFSIGIFISSITESQALAAIATFVVTLLTWLSSSLAGLFDASARTAWTVFAVILLIVSILVQLLVKKVLVTAIFTVLTQGALALVFFLKPALFEGSVSAVFDWLSVAKRFDNFNYGIFDVTALVYYACIVLLFWFLTVRSVKQKGMKNGTKTFVVSAAAVAVAVAVSLIFSKLNITFDFTSSGMYTLNGQTKSYIAGLDDKITVYYLEPNGEKIDIFDKILGQFEKYSSKIDVVVKDPELYPTFYKDYSDEELSAHSLIVVNERTGRSKCVDYNDYLVTEYAMDYSTYSYKENVVGIDLEGQLDSAIGFVSSNEVPTVYVVSGHGETAMGTAVKKLIEKANIVVKELTLITSDAVPEDCDVLFIQNPQSDYLDTETTLVRDYLDKGGKAVFALSFLNADQKNLMALLNSYGITVRSGVAVEGGRQYYMSPVNIICEVSDNSFTSGVYGKKYVLAQYAGALSYDTEVNNMLNFLPILSTSGNAYLKAADADNIYREDGDETGMFYLGYNVSNPTTGMSFCVFSSLYLFDDAFSENSGTFGNIDILVNSINNMTETENAAPAVSAINLEDSETLAIYDAATVLKLIAALLAVPVVMLITGIVVVVSRRRNKNEIKQ